MINGMHALMYAENAGQLRRFFRDVLEWPHVDAGHGWLIFRGPPSEIAAHPAGNGSEAGRCELYFMCDDVHATVERLRAKGVEIVRPPASQAWGILTAIKVPGLGGSGQIGLYQPKHPTAYNLGTKKSAAKKKASSKKAGKKTKKASTKRKPGAGRR